MNARNHENISDSKRQKPHKQKNETIQIPRVSTSEKNLNWKRNKVENSVWK